VTVEVKALPGLAAQLAAPVPVQVLVVVSRIIFPDSQRKWLVKPQAP
jgi:hypothetical protein